MSAVEPTAPHFISYQYISACKFQRVISDAMSKVKDRHYKFKRQINLLVRVLAGPVEIK